MCSTSARRLPELEPGRVGDLAFFLVCGLFGASLAVAGLRIYSTVNAAAELGHVARGEVVASGLAAMLWEAGSLAALAVVAYLLAPAAESVVDSESA